MAPNHTLSHLRKVAVEFATKRAGALCSVATAKGAVQWRGAKALAYGGQRVAGRLTLA